MSLNAKEEAALKLIEEDQSISNYFFSKVSDVKFFFPLKEKGYFSPDRAPGAQAAQAEGYYYFPEWSVLPYLERISRQVEIPEYSKYVGELLAIIKEVSKFNPSNSKLDNYRIWASFIRILANIPNKSVPIEVLDLIPFWLESKFGSSVQTSEICTRLLPKYLCELADEDDIKKAEIIIKHLTHIEATPLPEDKKELYGREVEFKFRADSYWLEKAIENTNLIAKKCSINVIHDIADKIESMLKNETDGAYYSMYSRGNIHEPLDLLIVFLIDVLNEKAKLEEAEIENVLDGYIKQDYLLFQKIALYVYGNNAYQFKEQIWANIQYAIGDSVVRIIFVGDELKKLLNNLQDLDNAKIEKLKAIIKKGPQKDIPEEEHEHSVNIWKQRICQALSHISEFQELYNDLKRTTLEDTELGPAVAGFVSVWGSEQSPLKREEILEKSNKELATFFNNYHSDNYWNGPTVDGLSDILRDIVKDNPDKFVEDLSPFLEVGYLYVYDILWGVRDAWKEKKRFSWEKLLSFVEQYINREEFWSDRLLVKGSHWGAKHSWVLRILGDLIQDGVKDEKWTIGDELVPEVNKIVTLALNNIIKNKKEYLDNNDHDPITHALNSAPGTLITANLLLALRKARTEKKKDEATKEWLHEYLSFYEQLFGGVEEAFTLFGQYLPNYWYLDEEWTTKQIVKQENVKEKLWMSFIIGYLYGGTVYIGIFKLMKGHYERAIGSDIKDKLAEERLAQHIVLGFLDDVVTIDGKDLLCKLIDRNKPSYMDALVRYLRGQFTIISNIKESDAKEGKQIKIEKKASEIWSYVYDKYKGGKAFSTNEKEILSSLLMLTIFLRRIDSDNYPWIQLSLSAKENSYYDRFLLDDLIRIKSRDKSVEVGRYIGKIMVEIAKKNIPTLFKEKIKVLVQYLYDLRDGEAKNEADRICEYYFRASVFDDKGEIFLRDVYGRYR